MKRIGMLICAVLSAGSLVYANAVRTVGSGTGFFIFWVLLAVCFMLLLAAIRLDWFSKLPKRLRAVCVVCVCTFVAAFLGIEGCILNTFHAEAPPNLDYIVVLGAQVRKNGPSKVLKYRLEEARAYMKQNPDTICILSGGKGKNEPVAEAVGMSNYMVANGIDPARLKLETKSLTTAENLSNSRHLMEMDATVGIVTNNFHVFRAVQTAKRYGLRDAVGIAAPSSKKYLLNNMVREFFAEIKFLFSTLGH
ncbi:Uncharacterized SAM-binding protein YcdF, DUF218 family [Lachnospiraceae bacterium XBB1006]|nr:Uncharacterized SAM-binding protein YcdF, DUF218 family [Lachnospiraceae bacterium XBB1006]